MQQDSLLTCKLASERSEVALIYITMLQPTPPLGKTRKKDWDSKRVLSCTMASTHAQYFFLSMSLT